jgi:putative component of membrane protein insertase Oxa1/YidC/SpoIIIJ protein YidD
MEPSDSTYATESIRRHGLIRGTLHTADRLHRCGHDLSAYPLVNTARGLKYSDPAP